MSDKRSGQFRITSNAVAVMKMATKFGAEDLEELCGIMEAHARAGTPVKTGNNKRSITHDPPKMEGNKLVARVYTTSGYGGWLEIGTSKMEARPYMAPAYDTAHETMRQKVANRK